MHFESHAENARRNAESDYAITLKAATAGGMAPLSVFGGGGQNSARLDFEGRQREQDSADQSKHFIGQVFTSVRPIAQRIAGQPIRLARIGPAPKGRQRRIVESRQYAERELRSFLAKNFGQRMKAGADVQVIDQHPVLDVLNDPSPSLPGWTDWHLKCFTVASLEVTGASHWWLPTVNGKRELWTLPSYWVRPLSDGPNMFTGWAVHAPGTTEHIELPPNEVKRFFYPGLLSPLQTYGPLEAGIRNVLVDEYIVESQKRQFQQGYKPGVVVKAGSQLRDKSGKTITPRLRQAQYNQLIEAINARMRGVIHHGEPLILDALIESVTPWEYKPTDMDYGGSQDKSQARVEQLFGTNPYIAGAASLGSRAEAAEADAQFCNGTVNPKIEMLSKALTIFVLPEFDDSGTLVLFIEPCRPRDSELDAKEWEVQFKGGGATINMGLARLGMPPVPWGDAIVVPANCAVVPVSKLADGYYPPNASPPTGGAQPAPTDDGGNSPDPDAEDEELAMGDESADDQPGSAAAGHVQRKVYDDAFYAGMLTAWLKSHGASEQEFEAALSGFFDEQREAVQKQLAEQYGGLRDVADLRYKTTAGSLADAIFQPRQWDKQLVDVAAQTLARIAGSAAKTELDAFAPAKKDAAAESNATPDIQYDFGVDLPPAVKSGIAQHLDAMLGSDAWRGINDTTHDTLARTIQAGLDAGETLRQITADIDSNVFGGAAKERAENIARTETTAAMNLGQHVAGLELEADGIIEAKEWAATIDSKTRTDHAATDGQQRACNAEFDVAGYGAQYPGDPSLPAKERCRCRCARLSVTAYSSRSATPLVKLLPPDVRKLYGCDAHG